MGAFKKLGMELREIRGLDDLAIKLGGDVDGRFIRMPSPNRGRTDRTCWVSINPADPSRFYIYDCEGSRKAAYARVHEALGVLAFRPRDDNTEGAMRLWQQAGAADQTIVSKYLRGRRITLPPPPSLRFHPRLWQSKDFTGPAMISSLTDASGAIRAVHQTWLREDGSDKADIETQRQVKGPSKGCAIRLCPVAGTLAVAEGIETALSFMQASGIPTWSAGSAGGLRSVNLPPEVSHVVIAADGDERGEAAAFFAANRFRKQGRTAEVYRAPAGKDFNDLLRENSK